MKTLAKKVVPAKLREEDGKIGYLVAWLLGVPASVLLVIFLLFGRS